MKSSHLTGKKGGGIENDLIVTERPKILKFQMSIFLFFHCLWIKTVETCRKHASEVDKSLKWVGLDDPRE